MGTALLETVTTEQHAMRDLFQSMMGNNLLETPQHAVTLIAMKHS